MLRPLFCKAPTWRSVACRLCLAAPICWPKHKICESNRREYFCEHRGEESVRGLSAQRGFIPLGRESDQLRVTPADVEPHCLCAPPWWLGSHLQARIPFLREVQRNRSKDLETWPPVHSKGNTHPQTTTPSRYTCFVPQKRNSKAGWPGRLKQRTKLVSLPP